MRKTVAQKLIESHIVSGKMRAGEEIALRIDQTLTQDATGTLVMLEFEAMNMPRVRTELSAQYVDHNLCNFGILPLAFVEPGDWERINRDDVLAIEDVRKSVRNGPYITVYNRTKNEVYKTMHRMSSRQAEIVLAGGLINHIKSRKRSGEVS